MRRKKKNDQFIIQKLLERENVEKEAYEWTCARRIIPTQRNGLAIPHLQKIKIHNDTTFTCYRN